MKSTITHHLTLLGILLIAALLLLTGSWYCYTSTFDTATVGLMSVNITRGEYPLFFYGQPYFGALEAYVAALYITVFGFSEFILTLSPISFTLLWVIFTYLLFSRIFTPAAGKIAMLCVAFSGYYVFWYSIATYGGYSVIFCLGTAILWLSLLIFQDRPAPIRLIFYSVCLGCLTSLALWVHALTIPYIAIAAGLLALYALKEKLKREIIIAFAIALAISLTGFLPFYIETGSFLGGISESVKVTLSSIVSALSNLFGANIYELVIWNFLSTFNSSLVSNIVFYGSAVLLVSALGLAILSLCSNRKKLRGKIYYLIPIAFCIFFLSLYVQHHMATVKAPRYAIGFWTMLLCIVWSLAVAGQHNERLKKISSTLFLSWLMLQVSGTVLFIKGSIDGARKEKSAMHAIVAEAKENDLKSVVTYGDKLLGYKAQKLSMLSQNRVVFANSELERYYLNAQFTELDQKRGYLTTQESKRSLENTFKELGIRYSATEISGYYLFTDLEPNRRYTIRSADYTEISSPVDSGIVEVLNNVILHESDRNTLRFQGQPLFFDIGEVRSLCSLWMFTNHSPYSFTWSKPGPFDVSVSKDGITFEKIFSSLPESGNASFSGDYYFIGGPWGKVEALFDPVEARYVMIDFPGGSDPKIAELFIFKTDLEIRKSSENDYDKILTAISDHNLQFIYADRWINAKLRQNFKGTAKEEITFPRHSSKFAYKPLRYFIKPEAGHAVLCESSVSEYCEELLIEEYGNEVILQQHKYTNYTLYVLADIPVARIINNRSALVWNGQIPINIKDIDLLAPWFNSLGMGIWRADYCKTKGIYHDSWSNGAGRFIKLNHTIGAGEARKLALYTNGWRPETDPEAMKLQVIINGEVSLHFREKIKNTYYFEVPDALKRIDSVEVRSTTFIPPGADSRELGIDIKRIEIH